MSVNDYQSARDATPDVEPRRPTKRVAWLAAGSLLWICVAIALFVVWRKSQERPDTIESAPELQAIKLDDPAGNSAAEKDGGTEAAGVAEEHPWDPNGIEDFSFTERSGKTVTKADLLGKPWAVCFIFTRCAGPCRDVTMQMKRLSDAVRDADVRLIAITVDPDFDTPEKLTAYANIFDADPEKWLFLTGEKEKVYRLILRSFLMPVREMHGDERKPGFEVMHTTNIMLVDAQGKVVDYYDGKLDVNMVELRRALLREAEKTKSTSVTPLEAPKPTLEGA